MSDSKSLGVALIPPALALVAGFGIGTASAAPDNENQAALESQQVAQSSERFSDEQLEAFINARDRVAKISQEWEGRLENAESQDELTSLQQQAQEETVEAIRNEGLSVNDYNMIVDTAQSDKELMRRLNEIDAQ